MENCCYILNWLLIFLELYLQLSASFKFVPLYFDVGEIVVPNFAYCLFIFSVYAHTLWQLSKYTANHKQILGHVIGLMIILLVVHFLLTPIWIFLVSCAMVIIKWTFDAGWAELFALPNEMDIFKATATQIIWLSYVSLALSFTILDTLFWVEDIQEDTPPIRNEVEIIEYRIPK